MPPPSTPSRLRWLATAVLAVGTFALYGPVANHPFILLDDTRYLTENPVTQAGLTWEGVRWAFTTLHVSNWHPLTWLSHMLDVSLFGMSPGTHHLANAAWHAANAALLTVALARLTGAFWRSLMVAALFAVHPLHVESVAWVAERKDLLSTFFGLLALLAYARHAERPSAGRLAVVGMAFAASLLSKPMWVTLPFLLLLLDVWPLRRLAGASPDAADTEASGERPRLTLGRLVAEKVPLLVLSVASSAITVVAQGRGNAIRGLELGLGARLGNALVAYARYLGKTFWPTDLAVFYPHSEGDLAAGAVVASTLVLLAASALAIAQLRRRPWLALGWCWFLGTLVPVIGLVQVGAQAMADRYTYLPIIGIFIAVVWTGWELLGPVAGGWPGRALAGAVLLGLSGLTWHQLGYWKDHVTLFRHALAAGGESGLVHGVISEGLRSEGQLEDALAEAQQAVRLAPGTARHWNNLGVVLRDLQRREDARAAFQEAVRLDPGEASAWHRLAQVRAESGDLAGAIEADREAVRLKPDYGAAWTTLAIACQAAGRTEEATGAFVRMTEVEPGNFVGWRNLGIHLARQGRLAEAERALTEACRLRPGDADLLHRLGTVQLALGNTAGAAQTASRLVQIDPARAQDLLRRIEATR